MDDDPFRTVLRGAHPLSQWQAAGVPRHDLARFLGRRVHRGRWAFAASGRDDPVQRALEDASVLPPDGALGGWGAACLLGVEWLDGTLPSGAPVDGVLCLPPHRRVRRPRTVSLRSRLDPGDVVHLPHLDLRVTSPVRTAFDLARTASDLAQAVERLDCMLVHGVLLGDVAAYARARPRWSGVGLVRRAVALATGRIRSPAESRWRMVWVLGAELPSPLVNATVLDRRGHVQAEVDLLDPRSGLVGEYDGSPHSGAARRSKDTQRQERLERLGLTLVRCTGSDLHEPAVTVARLRAGAARAEAVGGARRWTARELPIPGRGLRRHSPV